mmetsp:Transcript_37959/g.65484  ORF Transcript_37959/g.65484 Transcript_37959/m.65484 type:complete len:282 (-) Transcript_37959:99-944(-)
MLLGPDQQGRYHAVVVTSIHVNGSPARTAVSGQSATFAVAPAPADDPADDPSCSPDPSASASAHRALVGSGGTRGVSNSKRRSKGGVGGANGSSGSPISDLKHKGMVLLSPSASCRTAPLAAFEFTAEVLLLHHPAAINVKYEPVVHVHTISQCAQITAIDCPPAAEQGDAEVEGGTTAAASKLTKPAVIAPSPSAGAAADDEEETGQGRGLEHEHSHGAEDKAHSSDKEGKGGGMVIREGQRATVRFKFMYKPEYVSPGDALLFREGCTRGIGRIIHVHG